ncbi:hypothetical protein IAD21_04779 [Abditibacteriota bacterium]|nr:hypothetical protein IAD21_04779 [Abditibacteriota bacterium]
MKKSLRRVALLLGALLLGALLLGALLLGALAVGVAIAFLFNAWHDPISGGQSPDNFFASREKARIYASFDPTIERQFVRLTPENANGWFHTFAEPIQSFELYQSQNPTRPTATRRVIVLQPLGAWKPEEADLLEPLRAYCSDFFQLPARIVPPLSLAPVDNSSRPSGYFPGRKQYDAGLILSQILEPNLPTDAVAYLGVTMEDLKADDLSFVFGLGSWHERVGVYSLGRYFPKKRAVKLAPLDKKRALYRAMQVLNHETGHMLGLTHCTVYRCSMNGAISLPDSDRTPLEYCPLCQQKLAWNIGYSVSERAHQLQNFYRKEGLQNSPVETPKE